MHLRKFKVTVNTHTHTFGRESESLRLLCHDSFLHKLLFKYLKPFEYDIRDT